MASAGKHEAFRLLFDDITVKWKWTESELVRFGKCGVEVRVYRRLERNLKSTNDPSVC